MGDNLLESQLVVAPAILPAVPKELVWAASLQSDAAVNLCNMLLSAI